jgi:M6 family metalloprotease-like protein
LCLLVDFEDSPRHPLLSRLVLDDYCNLPGYNGFKNNGSVFDYFFDNSGGKLHYTNRVLDYYRAAKPKSYYRKLPFPLGAQTLVAEALEHWRKREYDFSGLSTDYNNHIFAVNVMYAGLCDDDSEQGLWAHQHYLETPMELMPDAIACDYQICAMKYELTLGTFCHETGHLLCEFPDLYDKSGNSCGVGDFCLMAKGYKNTQVNPALINAYLKYQAGWAASVIEINGQINARISTETNDFFIHRNPKNAAEYFIIENRHQSKRDESLPGSGLAIWHIDENIDGNKNQDEPPNSLYECSLEQADGYFELERGLSDGDATDLFCQPKRFTDDTMPNSKWRDGTASNLEIGNISAAEPIMQFAARVQTSF